MQVFYVIDPADKNDMSFFTIKDGLSVLKVSWTKKNTTTSKKCLYFPQASNHSQLMLMTKAVIYVQITKKVCGSHDTVIL
jgi:hypothetical protein